MEISIRAPARGATLRKTKTELCWIYFNPRSREGSDLLVIWLLLNILRFQSALPRGERRTFIRVSKSFLVFQSALPRGERHVVEYTDLPDFIFQSALPRGERLKDVNMIIFCTIFQSALPRGERRSQCRTKYPINQISIRAPARGATRFYLCISGTMTNFNPRSREGSDGGRNDHPCFYRNFNPRSREGSDPDTVSI